jgi:hypothetical protein
MDLANRLAIYGYKGDLDDFDWILTSVWARNGYMDHFSTVEFFLCHPTSSVAFCKHVRKKAVLDEDQILDCEILLRLLNIRKNGILKRYTKLIINRP